jgi:cold-inducible RNA-binding protein
MSVRSPPRDSPVAKGALMAMRIYVGGLPYSTTSDDLLRAFGAYGEVAEAVVASDRDTGRSKGFGFVQMSDDTAAQSAIAGLDGSDLGGRTITVNPARPREDRSGSRSPREDGPRERRW